MDPPARVTNRQIAAIFFEVADLLETEGVKFKPIAYRRAAHVIETLSEDVAAISGDGKLEEIPGVGTHIAAKIREILATGKLAYYDRLKSEIPPGVLELAELGGIGPKKAMILSSTLGITSTEGLEEAAKAGKIRGLKGFRREDREEHPAQSIEAKKGTGKRFLLGNILPVAEDDHEGTRRSPGDKADQPRGIHTAQERDYRGRRHPRHLIRAGTDHDRVLHASRSRPGPREGADQKFRRAEVRCTG